MLNTTTTDPSEFQIPDISGAEFDPSAVVGQEYAGIPVESDDLLDLYDVEVPDDASSLFDTEQADEAREDALQAAISGKEAVNHPVNAAEIVRFAANAGHELATWRHISVAAQDTDFMDALRAKAKNGRW